jgi:hypothetical protein
VKTQLPIDSSGLTFIYVMPPGPAIDRQTKQKKPDAGGEPLSSIELVCIGAEGGKVLSVKFADRFGLTLRATKVEPLPTADAETGRQAQQWWATGLNR